MRLTRRLLRPGSKRAFWWAVGLTFLGAVLRSADLLGRSMWMDEGITYMRLASSLTDTFRNVVYVLGKPVIDTQPPAYFLLLKAWIPFGGDSEFSLKWLTAMLGVLVVPLTFTVGRRLFGALAGLLAGLFILLSPGVQWYSHEVRMYTLVVSLAALSVLVLHQALKLRATEPGIWVAVFGVWAVAVLTHYSFIGLVASQAVFAFVVLLVRWRVVPHNHRRMLVTLVALITLAGVVLALLPDVQSLFRRLSGGRPERDYYFVPLDVMFWSELNGFLFGLNTPDPRALLPEIITWVVGTLCVLGALLPSAPRAKRRNQWILLIALIAPVLIWFGISLIKPSYQGFRHLMLILPFIAVLLGRLVWVLWQRGWFFKLMGGLVVIAIAASQVYGLAYVFIRTPNWHDDFRGLAYYIRDHWQDGDVIVIPAPVQAATVMAYLRGFPWRHFPESTAGAVPTASVESASRQQARRAFASQFRRVWYLPLDYETGAWFARDFFKRKQVRFPSRSGAIQLELFEIESPITPQLPTDVRRVSSDPGSSGLTLAGYRFAPAARFNPQPNTQLSLYWQRGVAPPDKDMLDSVNTSFRLFYGGRPWWDFELPGELDVVPSNWEPGDFFRVDYVLPLPLGLPQVPYELKLELRRGSKGEAFQSISEAVSPADVSCCMRIVQWPVAPPAQAQANLANPTNPLASPLAVPAAMPQPAEVFVPQSASLADGWTTWRGQDAALMKIEYPDEVRAGEFLPIVLTWRANQSGLLSWQTELRLEPLIGSAVATTQREAGTPDFPVAAWPIHQPVRDDYSLQVPYALDAGWFKLVLLRQRAGVPLDSLVLGLVRVADYPASPVPITIQHAVPATVGDLALLGWSLDRATVRDTTLEFRTLWRVDARPKRDGVLFLHVFAPEGSTAQQPYVQDDNTPEYGKRFTLTYRPGEGIDQLHRVVLPPDAPAGEYKLFAGVYDRDKGCCRWSAQQNGQPAKDDLVYLGSFSLPKLPELIFKTYVPVATKP